MKRKNEYSPLQLSQKDITSSQNRNQITNVHSSSNYLYYNSKTELNQTVSTGESTKNISYDSAKKGLSLSKQFCKNIDCFYDQKIWASISKKNDPSNSISITQNQTEMSSPVYSSPKIQLGNIQNKPVECFDTIPINKQNISSLNYAKFPEKVRKQPKKFQSIPKVNFTMRPSNLSSNKKVQFYYQSPSKITPEKKPISSIQFYGSLYKQIKHERNDPKNTRQNQRKLSFCSRKFDNQNIICNDYGFRQKVENAKPQLKKVHTSTKSLVNQLQPLHQNSKTKTISHNQYQNNSFQKNQFSCKFFN